MMKAVNLIAVVLVLLSITFAKKQHIEWCSTKSLGQILDSNASIFPGDPSISITIWDTIEADGYKLEKITMGTHTGTHMSAPCHFIKGKKCVDQLSSDSFLTPAYLIDVRTKLSRNSSDYFVEWADVQAYERSNGAVIPRGAMVMLWTGNGPRFGTVGYSDPVPGFSADCVQKMFDNRHIFGTASDSFGPDASIDQNFKASYTTYLNDGVTLENLGDLSGLPIVFNVMFTPNRLKDGSGFPTNVVALIPCNENDDRQS